MTVLQNWNGLFPSCGNNWLRPKPKQHNGRLPTKS